MSFFMLTRSHLCLGGWYRQFLCIALNLAVAVVGLLVISLLSAALGAEAVQSLLESALPTSSFFLGNCLNRVLESLGAGVKP
ncbi:MAG: hypothetical protein R2865_07585 [Deinococcales bacterium]